MTPTAATSPCARLPAPPPPPRRARRPRAPGMAEMAEIAANSAEDHDEDDDAAAADDDDGGRGDGEGRADARPITGARQDVEAVLVAAFRMPAAADLETCRDVLRRTTIFRLGEAAAAAALVQIGEDAAGDELTLAEAIVEEARDDETLARNVRQGLLVVRVTPFQARPLGQGQGIRVARARGLEAFHEVEVCLLASLRAKCAQACAKLLQLAEAEFAKAYADKIVARVHVHLIGAGLPVHVRASCGNTARSELGLPPNARIPSEASRLDRVLAPAPGGVLRGVHLRAPPPSEVERGGARVRVALGKFDFYHYGCQATEDRGWGCAYRALQMMLSYYALRGYALKDERKKSEAAAAEAVPDVVGIQRILKEMNVMGDSFQPPCEQWVGSQEISWVLSELVDVDCRFVDVNGRALDEALVHIEESIAETDTPVVACGANLALVIAGVMRPAPGRPVQESKVLVADPHYSGADDEDLVLHKTARMEGYSAVPVGWRTLVSILSPPKRAAQAKWTLVLPVV